MADFRRGLIALAVLALLTGFSVSASAQTPFSCNAQTAVPPLLRAEGVTELIGDIVLVCTGGTVVAPAAQPLANFQVFVGNTTITSRPSEPLLLINEPTTATAVGTGGAAGGQNVYTGAISGNSVSFLGVPIVAPGTTGNTIYRITNVRINASAIGGSAGFTGSQVLAFTSISGSTSILVVNPQQVVGFVQPGLAFSVRNAANDDTSSGIKGSQCTDRSKGTASLTLRYAEGFATAFKVQVAGTAAAPTQTTVGAVYNTESGLTWGGVAGLPATEGLANFGTRLRAVFNNIPAGASVYVSTHPLLATGTLDAQLIANDSTVTFPLTSTDTIAGVAGYKLPVDSTGTAVAVWEITASDPVAVQNFDFPVTFAWTANPGANTPAAGVQATVNGSFAPISTTSSSSSSAPIPRFVDLSTAKNVLIVNVCKTSLLFPFVSAANGFDTGVAIANTSVDAAAGGSQAGQAGTCTLFFFGDNAPSAFTTPNPVAGGTVYANVASSMAPNFQGYVIARCNFQYAHGFAFVQSTVGYTPSTAAMGYLALVLTRIDSTAEVLGE